MSEIRLLDAATALYGSNLGGANRSELCQILSTVAIEMECRHISNSKVSRAMESIHELALSASDDDILILAIAAGIRLRLPNLEIIDTEILTPSPQTSIAA